MEKDTVAIEKLMNILVKGIIIGKNVYADKEINLADLQHSDDLLELVKEAYEFIQSKPELGAEIKDISIPEILALVAKGDKLVKQIEQA